MRKQDVLILKAIASVRKELDKASRSGASMIEINAIMSRLATLYACLNVKSILR